MNRVPSSRTPTKPEDPSSPRNVSRYVFATLNVVSLFTLVGLAAVGMSHIPSTQPHPSDVTWAVDVTHSRPAADFVRMHNTIATRSPFLLGDASALPTGIGGEAANGVSLNRYVGAAHAMCMSLNVEEMKDRYDFRVCTSSEVLALTAVIPMSSKNHVLTYASSDGDDYETGEVKHKVSVRPGDTYSYEDFSISPPPVPMPPSGSPLAPPPSPPPPPSPLPPTENMQSFMGSDNEVNLGQVEANLLLVAYCCSGVYTHMTGEGPSRRRR